MKKLIKAFIVAALLTVPVFGATDFKFENKGGTADPVTMKVFTTGTGWTNIWSATPQTEFKVFLPTVLNGTLQVNGAATFSGSVSGITKTTVGLSNVDNTADVDKPVPTSVTTALNLKAPLASPLFTGKVGIGNPSPQSSLSITTGTDGKAWSVRDSEGVLRAHIVAEGTQGGQINGMGLFGGTYLAFQNSEASLYPQTILKQYSNYFNIYATGNAAENKMYLYSDGELWLWPSKNGAGTAATYQVNGILAPFTDFRSGVSLGSLTKRWEGLYTGGVTTNYVAKTADYTATATDYMIAVTPAAATTISLPAAATNTGRIYVIQKANASANAVTIDPNGAETINGSATYTVTDNSSVTIQSTGTAWAVLTSGSGGAGSTTANSLATTGAAVDVAAAAPPTAGKVLTATDATHATWQTPTGGTGGSSGTPSPYLPVDSLVPPSSPVGLFTASNLIAASTFTDNTNYSELLDTGVSETNSAARVIALPTPATPYSYDLVVRWTYLIPSTADTSFGVGWADSSTTAMRTYEFHNQDSANGAYDVVYTNPSTIASANPASNPLGMGYYGTHPWVNTPLTLRVTDDGATRKVLGSFGATNFVTLVSEAHTATFTPAKIVLTVRTTANYATSLRVLSAGLTGTGSWSGAAGSSSVNYSTTLEKVTAAGTAYWSTPDSADLSPTTGVTYSVWIKPFKFTTSAGIVSKMTATGGGDCPSSAMILTSSQVIAGINGAGGGCAGWGSLLQTNAVLPLNAWTHLVMTYSTTQGNIKLYIDGVLRGTGSAYSTAITDNASTLLVGAWYDKADPIRNCNCAIDELRYWKDTALSAADVAVLYNNGQRVSAPRGKASVPETLVWQFNEGSGTTAKDDVTGAVLTSSGTDAVNWEPTSSTQTVTSTSSDNATINFANSDTFTGYTWINQGAATISTASGRPVLKTTGNAGASDFHVLVTAVPATPYTATLVVRPHFKGVNSQVVGLALADSVSGKLDVLHLTGQSTVALQVSHRTSVSALSSSVTVDAPAAMAYPSPVMWLRVTDSGTTREYYASINGVNWWHLASDNRTFVTPDKIGVFVDSEGTTAMVAMEVLEWTIKNYVITPPYIN